MSQASSEYILMMIIENKDVYMFWSVLLSL